MKEMKRHLWLSLLSMVIIVLLDSCSHVDVPVSDPEMPIKEYATLKEALEDMDNVVSIDDERPEGLEEDVKETCMVVFRQPVDHVNPDKTFGQRVAIKFRGFDRPTVFVTQGYNITGYISHSGREIAKELNANVVMVEHRNFGESMTDDPLWKYETSWQASADLHAVYQAFKPILRGRWMSTGVSKNGETSVDYCYYYPNDMDLCTAFCSPFLTSLYDNRVGKYVMEESGTPAEREAMMAGICRLLEGGEQGLYKTFCDSVANRKEKVPSFTRYVENVFELFFNAFSYYSGDSRKEKMAYADDPVDVLFKKWHNTLVNSGVSDIYTYIVDCYKEHGCFMYDYERFSDLLDGTSFDKTEVYLNYLKPEDRWLVSTYDNSQRLSLLEEFLPMAQTPMLLVYSKDDPWTGARPETINPVTTKMVLNPIGVHSDKFSELDHYTPELTKEIMDYIRRYVY